MNLYKEPVPHTCLYIDSVIHGISKSIELCKQGIESKINSDDCFREIQYQLGDLEKTLEKIRSANLTLRDWGNDLIAECKDFECQINKLEKIINNE